MGRDLTYAICKNQYSLGLYKTYWRLDLKSTPYDTFNFFSFPFFHCLLIYCLKYSLF